MTPRTPKSPHHGFFVAAKTVVITFLMMFIFMLVMVVPQMINGLSKNSGSWDQEHGAIALFLSWFLLGPLAVVSILISLISLRLTDQKKWSGIYLATPFLAFGLSLFLESLFQSLGKDSGFLTYF
jgi:uncharacterized membrane protein YhaH (DUF805 family)